MVYKTYTLTLDLLHRLLRSNGNPFAKEKGIRGLQKALIGVYETDMERLAGRMDLAIHVEELHWLNNSRRVYFPVVGITDNCVMSGIIRVNTRVSREAVVLLLSKTPMAA